MKTLTADTYIARLLGRLTTVLCRYRRWLIIPHAVLFVVSVLYTAAFLQFDMNQDNLVGSNRKYHRNFLAYKKEFKQQDDDDLVVVVESEDPEKNRQFIERLGAKLDAETNLFRDVLYKPDLRMMGSKALLFVPEDHLKDLNTQLAEYQPFIRQFVNATNLISFIDFVNTQFRTARRETNAENDALIKLFPVLERIVTQATECLGRSGVPPSPGITALFNAGEEEVEGRLSFAHGQIRIAVAQALNEDLNGEAVKRLRALTAQTQREVPGLNVALTGGPVLDYDQMVQSQKDATLASIVSLIICALIFIYGYNETGRPVKATICLIVGLAYTMAFATLTVGHLNILTITFVPMLIGLAIDFGVHLVTRYEEELRYGRSEEEALTKAMVFTGQGIFTGAFTTAGAFLAMGLTNFKGIQEMGIICGGGLLICLFPMMTLLPVLLLRGRQNVIDHQTGNEDQRARIENIWLQRPVWVMVCTAVLCALALPQIRKVYFDYNLLDLQSAGLPAVEFERKLINSADKSVLFCAVVADSLDEAVALEDRIKRLRTVSNVDSIGGLLKEDQREKLKLIHQIKKQVVPFEFREPDREPVKIPELSRSLYSLYGYLGAALDEVSTNDPALSRQLDSLRQAISDLRKTMLQGDAAVLVAHADKLAAFQQAFFTDVRDTFEALQEQDDRAPLRIEDLPLSVRDRFVGVTGKYLLQVYPKKDAWQRDCQQEFITELRQALDPKETGHPVITGTPVQLYEYESLLKNSYEQAALYALGAIVILVFIHFRTVVP